MFAIDSRSDDAEMTIQVYGKQWWWEVHYTEPETVANIVTANDIYIPVGTRVKIELLSSNVIHSFYVPQLAGKMDLIPGHTNVMSIQADEPGMYYGECTEFCGDSHAYMRFKVIAVDDEQFAAWTAGMSAGPSSAAASLVPEGDLTRIPDSMTLCIACHRVGGVPNLPNGNAMADPPMGLEGGSTPENQILGPNLAMIACRTSLAAGILPDNEESMRAWLDHPGKVKAGNFMAQMIKDDTLSPEQIDDIVAYLKTLHPEAGCPVITGVNADQVEQLAGPNGGTGVETEATPVDEAVLSDRRFKS
jgi:cytochrome c oxidase subunit 2